MRNPLITFLVFLVTLIILAVVIADYMSTRPGRRPPNPFAYDVDEFRLLSEDLLRWRETGQIRLDTTPAAMAYGEGNIFLAAGRELQVIDMQGRRILRKQLPSTPTAIALTGNGMITLALGNYLVLLDYEGNITDESPAVDNGRFTSVAGSNGYIFVADAARRRVLIFNDLLEISDEFAGESGVSDIHGFILPDSHFSLAINPENELWITNPGLHKLQNYTFEGRLRSYIQRRSFDINGFSGCCNPVHFAFLPGGEFVTSEKGIIRVKVVSESGELVSVVAPSDKFERGTRAPAVAADESGNVLLLDFDKNMVRIFEPV